MWWNEHVLLLPALWTDIHNYRDGFRVSQSNGFQHLVKLYVFLNSWGSQSLPFCTHACRHMSWQRGWRSFLRWAVRAALLEESQIENEKHTRDLHFSLILHSAVCLSEPFNDARPSYLTLGPVPWSLEAVKPFKLYLDILVGTFS